MILFFHFLCLLARYIVTSISKSISKRKLQSDEKILDGSLISKSSELLQSQKDCTKPPVYENGVLKFFPPVYIQRYETVALILKETAKTGKIQKVVDFGCAELGFFIYLKNIEGLKEIIEVDIDSETLERYSFKAAPLTTDYLMSKSNKPLDVYIFQGSIADYDDSLVDTDVVIGIELIEHLSEEAFKKMPHNVFSQIKPLLAIFTTPNADFNSLFPNLTDVRHSDHKFEWSRKEFFNWTQEIIKKYPEYSIQFYGVGAGPEGSENLGCCSQMAVFRRTNESNPFTSAREESLGIHNYKLINHFKYPVNEDSRTREEKIIHEIQYQVSHIGTLSKYYNYEENESEIPLTLLKQFVSDLCPEDKEFRDILNKSGMKIRKKNNSWFLVYTEPETCSLKSSLGDDEMYLEEIVEEIEKNEKNYYHKADWDEEEFRLEEISNFLSARSVEEFKDGQKAAEKSGGDFYRNLAPDYFFTTKDGIESTPGNDRNFLKNFAPLSCNSKNGALKQATVGKSRIPRKRKPKENLEEDLSSSSNRKSNLTYVRKLRPKMSKSFSLDSCLENVNCKTLVTPGGPVPFCGIRSLSSSNKSKRSSNGSGSSLFSCSFEKGADSGYPYSLSPLGADSTPMQADELLSESKESSWSSSESSEAEADAAEAGMRRHPFAEEVLVENGDLANNNRDREGNNVEGLLGERLANGAGLERDPNDNVMFFPEVEEFPPWLLHLGDLAPGPVFVPPGDDHEDAEMEEASASDFDRSLD